jgi:hypothetical protein
MENAPVLGPYPDPMSGGLSTSELDAVRARRAGLRRASRAVREVLRTPPGSVAALTQPPLEAALAELAEVWARHTAQTEADDGVLAQVLADCPRLAPAIGRLRREHAAVAEALAAVAGALAAVRAEPGTADAVAVAAEPGPVPAATGLDRLLDTVEKHRRAGRELLYEAYQVDLGLGE